MTRRLAQLILRGYPLAFRRRYGDEMLALLEQTPTGALKVLDLLRGAFVAHLRPMASLNGLVDSSERLRASTSGILACWVAFAAAGFGFYKTTEGDPFEAAGSANSLLGGAHLAIQILAIVGSIAVMAGACPLILATVTQARSDRKLRVLVSVPIVAVFAFALLTALLVWLAHGGSSPHPTTTGGMVFVLWELAGLVCGAVCVVAARRALFAIRVARGWLVAAFAGGALVSVAMVAMTIATAVYTIALSVDASALAGESNGPLQATSVCVSLVEQLIVMLIACALAAITTHRGSRMLVQGRASAARDRY